MLQLCLPGVCTERRLKLKMFFHCTNFVENLLPELNPGQSSPVIPGPKQSAKRKWKDKLTHMQKFPLYPDLLHRYPLSWVMILFCWGASPQIPSELKLKPGFPFRGKIYFPKRNKYLILFWKIKKREEKREAERERKKQVCLRGDFKKKRGGMKGHKEKKFLESCILKQNHPERKKALFFPSWLRCFKCCLRFLDDTWMSR